MMWEPEEWDEGEAVSDRGALERNRRADLESLGGSKPV